jgi:hypothetical protein
LNSLTCAARLAMSELSRRMMGSDSCASRDCSAERTRESLSATKMRICRSVPTRSHLSSAFHRTSIAEVDVCQTWPWSNLDAVWSIPQAPNPRIRHSYSFRPIHSYRSPTHMGSEQSGYANCGAARSAGHFDRSQVSVRQRLSGDQSKLHSKGCCLGAVGNT